MSIIVLNKKIFNGTMSNVDEPEMDMLAMGIDIDGKLKVKESDGNVYTIGDIEPFIGLSYSKLDVGVYSDSSNLIDKINVSDYRFVSTNDILFISGINQGQYGSYYQKWLLLKNNISIGTQSSYIVNDYDLELLYSNDLSSISGSGDIVDLINPNAIKFNLYTQSTNIIEDIVNNDGPFVLNEGDDVFFTFKYDDNSYIYRFLINDAGSYGIGETQTIDTDFLLIYNSSSDQYIEGTYDEIYNLKLNSNLIPNRNYIITDYLNEYIISGSDTSKIVNEITSIGAVSGYAQFNLDEALPNGLAVELTGLPDGYVGSAYIGMTGNITTIFGTQYYKFSNLPEITGMTIKYELSRYSVEFDDLSLYDISGKPIYKPGGVLNTEVHNGTSYGTMSSVENLPPPLERIVLTAVSTNKFSENAFSDTFEGDFLIYDFNDNIINDSNGNFIKNKRGTVKRRWNNALNIDIDKDWRSQKYRRYRCSDTLFDRYKFLEEVYKVQTPTGITYSVGGMVNSLYNSEGHRYTLLELENKNHLNDFTNGDINSNIFELSVSNTTIDSINLMSLSTAIYRYSMDFNLLSSDINFKDYNILPLDDEYNPTNLIDNVKVKKLENTVFLNNNKNFGSSNNIEIYSENSEIKDSTFLSGIKVENYQESIINKMTTFDTGIIYNTGTLYSVRLMSNNWVKNNGSEIFNTTFGSAAVSQNSLPQFFECYISNGCKIYNSVISSNYTTSLNFINTSMSCSFFHIGVSYLSNIRFNGHLAAFREGTYHPNNYIRNLNLDLDNGFNKNPNKVNSYGFNYKLVNTGGTLYMEDHTIKTMRDTKALYEISIDSGTINIGTASIPT